MVKARSSVPVAARFTMEVAPLQAVSMSTMRRRAAPVRRLEPIPEDDGEQLAYWSEYHHQLQADDTAKSSGFAAAPWSKRAPAAAQANTGGGGGLCRASSRKGHHRRVV